jgi:proteic killer suppression protein
MICSFGDKETEKIWLGIRSSKLPIEIQDVARRKLRMLANSHNLSDLKIPPSNHLEKLSGNLAGKFSIRINQKWRLVFIWEENQAFEVQIIDYH